MVPNCVFSSPEVASCGLTEDRAEAEGIAHEVAHVRFNGNSKAVIDGDADGFVRIVCEPGGGRVLGASLVGPHVTELVHELALAAHAGLTLADVAATIHAHPTLSEAVGEAALGGSVAACTACERGAAPEDSPVARPTPGRRRARAGPGRKPAWLKVKAPAPRQYRATGALLDELELHTVCREARCPNKGECYASGTATFLILGDVCTRACRFCAVEGAGRIAEGGRREAPGAPRVALDPDEPRRVAEAARRLGLRHVVVTSVTRDDLPDGGAAQFAAAVAAVRAALPGATVEVLIPDLGGDEAALGAVLAARPDVLNHNLETVPRLYAAGAAAGRLRALAAAAAAGGRVGARRARARARRRGRHPLAGAPAPARWSRPASWWASARRADEVDAVLADCAAAGVDAVTIGQYLQPDAGCLPVARYVAPAEFAGYERPRRRARPARASRRRSCARRTAPARCCEAEPDGAEPSRAALTTPAGPLPLPTPAAWSSTWTTRCCAPATSSRRRGTCAPARASGCELDAARWPQAERAAYAAAKARRRADGEAHDDGLLAVIAHAIIEGLGGGPAARSSRRAAGDRERLVQSRELRPLRRRAAVPARRCSAAGVRMALVSNALGHSLEEIVAHFALDDFIDASVSSADIGVVKPAPRDVRDHARALGVAPGAP